MDRSDSGGGVDFDSDTLKFALLTGLPAAGSLDTWNTFNQVLLEVAGGGTTGYVAGGSTVGGMSVTASTAGHTAAVNATAMVWATATFTATAGVLYKSTGTATTSVLIAVYDFGGTFTATGGSFTVSINAAGLLLLT